MAEGHPIQGLMYTAMQSIKEMVDVNTIVGTAVETPDGTVIIPISKVSFGFGVGGSEYLADKDSITSPGEGNMFGGGSGAGASIKPVAFLVVGGGQIKLLPVDQKAGPYDKLIEFVPEAIDKLTDTVKKFQKKKPNEIDEIAIVEE